MAKETKLRLKDVKRFELQGVTYTYHRPTGIPLPDLPYQDRRFIEALKAVRRQADIKSESGFDRTKSLALLTAGFQETTPPQTDAVAFTVVQCAFFVLKAKPNAKLLYHSGDLATDSATDVRAKDRQQYIGLAASFGLLSLRMVRIQENWSHYYALRTEESLRGMPMHVLQCDITPSEYKALVAINEKQASKSVSRTIRDALACSDQQAADIRNAMIERGWLANSRPPELTSTGRQLMG